MKLLGTLTTALLATVAVPPAGATPILTFSGTLPGLTFTVESVTLAATDLDPTDFANDTYDVVLGLTTTAAAYDEGYYPGTDYLKTVAIDIGGAYSAGGLVSSPGGWTFSGNNNGISGASGQCAGNVPGTLCAEDAIAGPNLALDADAFYEWVFRVDLGALGVAGQFGTTTTLKYVIATPATNGQSRWVISDTLQSDEGGTLQPSSAGDETPAAVPEPVSLVLFGTGAAFLAHRLRRRNAARHPQAAAAPAARRPNGEALSN